MVPSLRNGVKKPGDKVGIRVANKKRKEPRESEDYERVRGERGTLQSIKQSCPRKTGDRHEVLLSEGIRRSPGGKDVRPSLPSHDPLSPFNPEKSLVCEMLRAMRLRLDIIEYSILISN